MFRNVFIYLTVITLTIALPTFSNSRLKREVIISQPVTVIQTRAGSSSQTTHVITPTTCITVDDDSVPTLISVGSNALSYEIVGYSDDICSDDIVLNQTLSQPLEINSRRPLCSFKLGNIPLSIAPVKVTFSYSGSDDVQSFITNDTKCYDLCNKRSEKYKYPKTIKILEEDGLVANNFIQVSETLCGRENFGSKFMSNRIRNAENLVNITKRDKVAVKAFQTIPLLQNN